MKVMKFNSCKNLSILISCFLLSHHSYAGRLQMGDLAVIPDEVMAVVLLNLSPPDLRSYSAVSKHAHYQANNPLLKKPTLFERLATNHHEVARQFYQNTDKETLETDSEDDFYRASRVQQPTGREDQIEHAIHYQQTRGDPSILIKRIKSNAPWELRLSGFKKAETEDDLHTARSFWSATRDITIDGEASGPTLKRALKNVPTKAQEYKLRSDPYNLIHSMSDELLSDLELLSNAHSISVAAYRVKEGQYRCLLKYTNGHADGWARFSMGEIEIEGTGSTPEAAITSAVQIVKERDQLDESSQKQFDTSSGILTRICKKVTPFSFEFVDAIRDQILAYVKKNPNKVAPLSCITLRAIARNIQRYSPYTVLTNSEPSNGSESSTSSAASANSNAIQGPPK